MPNLFIEPFINSLTYIARKIVNNYFDQTSFELKSLKLVIWSVLQLLNFLSSHPGGRGAMQAQSFGTDTPPANVDELSDSNLTTLPTHPGMKYSRKRNPRY